MPHRISIAFAYSILYLFTLSHATQAAPPDQTQSKPNIVFAIADDWSWPHSGADGDPVVKTPNFDRLAREGMRFSRVFCLAPSCTPSRGSILCGQEPHRLEQGGNLWSQLPSKFVTYPDLLEQNGYHVGVTRKGWGPGTLEDTGRTRNPAGPSFKSFDQFLKSVPQGKPFCYWFGSYDPHRPYEKGSGVKASLDPDQVNVPAFLPDTPEIRRDILDYYVEVQRFDSQVGEILKSLENAGLAQNTLVVVTSDNGMPFPRTRPTSMKQVFTCQWSLAGPQRSNQGKRPTPSSPSATSHPPFSKPPTSPFPTP